MKKNLVKLMAVTTGIVAGVSLINYLIFKCAKRKDNAKYKERFYEWKLGDVRYVTAGEGEPLLLVHGVGIGCGLHEWHLLFNTLAKHYKVYAIDLLGFGYSDKPKMTYTAFLYTSLINDFIHDIIKEPVNVMTSSTSGAFAVTAYSLCPDLFKKFLLVCPTGTKNTDTPLAQNKDVWVRSLLESPIVGTSFYNFSASKYACGKFLKENCFYDKDLVTKEIIDEYYYVAHAGGSDARYPIASFMSKYLNITIEKHLQNISVPVKIIWGEEATFDHVEYTENSNISTEFLPKTKLLPHCENPKLFYKSLKKFF